MGVLFNRADGGDETGIEESFEALPKLSRNFRASLDDLVIDGFPA
jgi:hypothetical protein